LLLLLIKQLLQKLLPLLLLRECI